MWMFDDRVLLLWFVGVLVLVGVLLSGVMFSSLANFLLVGSWVTWGVVWALVR